MIATLVVGLPTGSGRGIKCYPCPYVRPVCMSVRNTNDVRSLKVEWCRSEFYETWSYCLVS